MMRGNYFGGNKGAIVSIIGAADSFFATWVIWYALNENQANDLFLPALTDKALVIPAIVFCGILYLLGLSTNSR